VLLVSMVAMGMTSRAEADSRRAACSRAVAWWVPEMQRFAVRRDDPVSQASAWQAPAAVALG